ncbi:MAG: anti-sigma factor family protein [bacterium]
MDCKKVSDLLSEFIDGTLNEAERVEFESHIDQCEKCQRNLRNCKATLSILHSIESIAVPSDFTENVFKKIEAYETGKRALTFAAIAAFLRIHRRTILTGLATFALAFGIAVSVLYRLTSSDTASIADQAPTTDAYVIKEVVQPAVVPQDTAYRETDESLWDELRVRQERYVFPVSSENQPF